MAEQKDKKALEKAKGAKPAQKKDGFLKKASRFFKDLKSEMKKVVWPTKKQVLNNTIIVAVVVVIAAVILSLLDLIFGFGLGMFLQTAV